MTPEEKKKMENLEKTVRALQNQVNAMQRFDEYHRHTGTDSNRVFFKDIASIDQKYEVTEGNRLRFTSRTEGTNTAYEIYREVGDGGALRIDSDTAGEGGIRIGDAIRPLYVYIYGTDEGLIGSNNGTNNAYLLVEPTKAGLFTNVGNNFTFRLPNGSGDPSSTSTGALAVVNGKLKIYDGAAWVVVGTQT